MGDIANIDRFIARRVHVMKRDSAKPVVDCKPPTCHLHVVAKLRRLQEIEDKNFQIQRDNRLLSEKILQNMVKKSQVDNHFEIKSCQIDRERQRLQFRQRGLMALTSQNAALLKRLSSVKSPYNSKELIRSYTKMRSRMVKPSVWDHMQMYNMKEAIPRYELERTKSLVRSRIYDAYGTGNPLPPPPECECSEDAGEESFDFSGQEEKQEEKQEPEPAAGLVRNISSFSDAEILNCLRSRLSKVVKSSDSDVMFAQSVTSSTGSSNLPFLPPIEPKPKKEKKTKKKKAGSKKVAQKKSDAKSDKSKKEVKDSEKEELKLPEISESAACVTQNQEPKAEEPKEKIEEEIKEEIVTKADDTPPTIGGAQEQKVPSWSNQYELLRKRNLLPQGNNTALPSGVKPERRLPVPRNIIKVIMEEPDPAIEGVLKKSKSKSKSLNVRFDLKDYHEKDEEPETGAPELDSRDDRPETVDSNKDSLCSDVTSSVMTSQSVSSLKIPRLNLVSSEASSRENSPRVLKFNRRKLQGDKYNL